MNSSELLERAHARSLTPDQVRELERQFLAAPPGEERLRVLEALGLQRDDASERAISHVLVSGDDVAAAALALRVLCGDWRRAAAYSHVVMHFMAGVPWDRDDALRLAAIAVAADHLVSTADAGMMLGLIRIAEDAEEPDRVRAAAIRALAKATGYRGKPVQVEL